MFNNLIIIGPPSIISHKTQFGIEGDNVRVECTAFSIPAPERVVWTFNGREVDLRDQDYSILEDPLPEGIKSTLIIRESQEKHFGMYNCSVTNPYGSDVVEINLMPQSKFTCIQSICLFTDLNYRKLSYVNNRHWCCWSYYCTCYYCYNYLLMSETES